MRLAFSLAVIFALSGIHSEAGQRHAISDNVEVEDADIPGTSIKWIYVKNVDPGAGASSQSDGVSSKVISLRSVGKDSQLQPKPTDKKDSTVSYDDKAAKNEDSSKALKLSEPFPTGVSVSAGAGKPDFTGLMKSQLDTATGNVERIVIPTDPPKTIDNPRKADNSPLTQLDLFKLGQGKVDSIPLKGGSVLNSPSGGPVSG